MNLIDDPNIIETPEHYTSRSMECIEVIRVMSENMSGFEAYCMGNIIKYIYRYKDKNMVEDLSKASKYIEYLKEINK